MPVDLQAPTLPSLLESRLRELIQQKRIQNLVETGISQPGMTSTLARLGPSMVAIGSHPADVELAELATHEAGHSHIRFFQGHPPRVLADLVRSFPEETLYFLNALGEAGSSIRDQIFHVPRGKGILAVRTSGSDQAQAEEQCKDQLLRWSPRYDLEHIPLPDGTQVLIATPKAKVHVTFLIEKYTHEYGTSGLSINIDNLVCTLQQTGLASYDIVHYDERYHNNKAIEAAELSRTAERDRHLLVCTCHYHSPSNPDLALLRQAKASGTKIAFMWLDRKTSMNTPEYWDLACVNVVLDGNDFVLPNAWPIFTPKNPMFFNDPGLERDIDLLLVGEMRHLKQRQDLVSRLEAETRVRATVVKTSAVDHDRMLSVEEYARLYKRSRIALALTKDSSRQLKGRVFEIAHCGALLVCDINPYINSYFEPGVEYVPFRDYEDMITRVQHLLAHEEDRKAIAEAGRDKAIQYYNHEIFWKSLLARAGLD